MRAVIQRVNYAKVEIEGKVHNEINAGLLIFLGVEGRDEKEDAQWLARKTASLRIFSDSEGLMNMDVNDISGQALVISQFTLHAKTKKGTRPSFTRAAKPDVAVPLYEDYVDYLHKEIRGSVKTGKFGADMKIDLENDGPVTIIIDTHQKDF